MPYYLLKITLTSGRISGVKEHKEYIDGAGLSFRYRAKNHYGSSFISMKIYGLEKNSAEVKAYLRKQAKQEPDELQPILNAPQRKSSSGPGKYREEKLPTNKPFRSQNGENNA